MAVLMIGLAPALFAQKIPMPDAKKTPGEVDPKLTKEMLCDKSFHTGTQRHVTESEKKQVCLAYGYTEGCPGKGFEIDHLVSIEVGGAETIKNLWPQPVDSPGVIGFHTKDKVENAAHRAVCAGTITLKQAQFEIATNWYQLGKNIGAIQ